jgi:hypothetical protein
MSKDVTNSLCRYGGTAYGKWIQRTAAQNNAYRTIIQVSTGEIGFEGLREWLGKNTTQ